MYEMCSMYGLYGLYGRCGMYGMYGMFVTYAMGATLHNVMQTSLVQCHAIMYVRVCMYVHIHIYICR